MTKQIVKVVSVSNTGGFKVDTTVPCNRKAVSHFLHRISKGEVFCEINNPQHRNKNPRMVEYNDNTCAKITSATWTDNDTLSMVIEPIGPAKHLLDNVAEDTIVLYPRANLELVSGAVKLTALYTYDIGI